MYTHPPFLVPHFPLELIYTHPVFVPPPTPPREKSHMCVKEAA